MTYENGRKPAVGIMANTIWRARAPDSALDVVLLTHPRDDTDLSRLLPWLTGFNADYRLTLMRHLRPVLGEVIEMPMLKAGIMFLTCPAEDIVNPRTRRRCREILEQEALPRIAETGAKVVCLGGLTASLTGYGRRIRDRAEALGLRITSGHSATVVNMLSTMETALNALDRPIERSSVVVMGMGSVGTGFARLLLEHRPLPRELVLMDLPSRRGYSEELAGELHRSTGCEIRVASTAPNGRVPPGGSPYRCDILVSAINASHVIEVDKLAPGTLLVDDSQPWCWSRDDAWQRCMEHQDIIPCEAGLVDCSHLNYVSHFPFDFADHDAQGSRTAWCCLTEGLMMALDPSLPPTEAIPETAQLVLYDRAYARLGFRPAPLQCGPHALPIESLRARETELGMVGKVGDMDV
ncbi:MAG: hypothetical protein WED00_00575 [Aquisalimonadaceae bacterium]